MNEVSRKFAEKWKYNQQQGTTMQTLEKLPCSCWRRYRRKFLLEGTLLETSVRQRRLTEGIMNELTVSPSKKWTSRTPQLFVTALDFQTRVRDLRRARFRNRLRSSTSGTSQTIQNRTGMANLDILWRHTSNLATQSSQERRSTSKVIFDNANGQSISDRLQAD